MLVDTLPEGGLLAIHWCFCSAALTLLVGRLIVRHKTIGYLMSDDYLMVAAWTVLLVNTILVSLQNHSTYAISKGFQGLLPLDQAFLDAGNLYVRYEFVSIGLFWTVTWLVKASFLAFYWKLLEGLFLYQKVWYGICVFAFLSYVGCWIASVLNCDPISDYWDFGKCNTVADQQRGTISIAYSTAVDILTDLLIMIIPLVLVYKVKITFQQKAGLVGVFSLAFVTIAIAIVRCIQSINNQRELVFLSVWSTVESAISVMIGCLPPFKILLSQRRKTGRTFGSTGNAYRSFSDDNGAIPLRSDVSKLSYSSNILASRGRGVDHKPKPKISDSLTEIIDQDESENAKDIYVRQDVHVTRT